MINVRSLLDCLFRGAVIASQFVWVQLCLHVNLC
jgi:hypothetical protein